MSLNFKLTNIDSSTKVLLTLEQIEFVLKPVQIILQQPAEIVEPTDTGPVVRNIEQEDFSRYTINPTDIRPKQETLDLITPFNREENILAPLVSPADINQLLNGSFTVSQLTNQLLNEIQEMTNPNTFGAAVGPFLPQDEIYNMTNVLENIPTNELSNNSIMENINIDNITNIDELINIDNLVDINNINTNIVNVNVASVVAQYARTSNVIKYRR
jgi:hypothetical protein